MKQSISNSPHQFPELTEAIQSGYNCHFDIRPDGLLQSLSNADRCYEINELSIYVLTCKHVKASLYLITTVDGVKGHMVDYWENYSAG
jgi:hypothetical protein